MHSTWTVTTIAVMLFAAGTDGATQFCTQDQKQLANELHEQNVEPAKSCYRAANGDITTLVTSRLCPLPECATWLAYMAENSPDCFYDSANYATVYAEKSADCSSSSGNASASVTSSVTGSSSSTDITNASDSSAKATVISSSSSMEMDEDRAINVADSMTGSVDGSAVGDIVSSVGSDSAAAASRNEIPTPTPTEDLTIEDTPAPALDSSNSTTPSPTPTTSASVSLPVVSAFTVFLSLVVAAAM